ncbi:MAG: M20/M25/M40 family metallo-hydrolase [Gammaproteobacteria bacterium]|nr:M20/M25/M40 family metallo-hydrolase [Gammaproteobacteria bacterium]
MKISRNFVYTLVVISLLVSAMANRTSADETVDNQADIAHLVSQLDFDAYKRDIEVLAGFGDREQGTQSYEKAAQWLAHRLSAAGYTVEYHEYRYWFLFPRANMYVTKIGTTSPDQMYIVSAHLDGRGGGGAADDDASGVAVVLEAALALAPEQIATDKSIRFVFWNSEESGADGSRAYMIERAGKRGEEHPRGSGRYPEPDWLGMIQHDMLLFDHGLPPRKMQIAEADLDIEYQADSDFSSDSKALAEAFLKGNQVYSTDYPAEIGDNMAKTDSWRFENMTAAISIRENRRMDEIGEGSNPHWHEPSDVPQTYSDADYRLGFNALQMTLGTIAELAGLQIVQPPEHDAEE